MLKKLFAGLGKKQSGTKQAEAIIQSITTVPYAQTEVNEIHFGYDELGGFFMLKTIIIGEFFIKTKKGIQLELFFKDNSSLELKSDSLELTSELSSISGRSITFIDYDLEKQQLEKIQNGKIAQLVLDTGKEQITFQV